MYGSRLSGFRTRLGFCKVSYKVSVQVSRIVMDCCIVKGLITRAMLLIIEG